MAALSSSQSESEMYSRVRTIPLRGLRTSKKGGKEEERKRRRKERGW